MHRHLKKAHHHIKHGLMSLVQKHPIVSLGLVAIGVGTVAHKITTPATSSVPQNPAPTTGISL